MGKFCDRYVILAIILKHLQIVLQTSITFWGGGGYPMSLAYVTLSIHKLQVDLNMPYFM